MIKNNESLLEITNKNIKYYINKKFNCKIGDIISIPTDTMPKMSHNKVIAICEVCNSENELPFSKYNRNKDRQGFYSCMKCSDKKRKVTNIKKYGIDNAFKREEVKEGNRKWMSSGEFKNKSKETIIEKYGVDSYSKTDEFRIMMSGFQIERIKYLKENDEYFTSLSLPDNRLKRENAMFEKYGATYSFYIPDIKRKIQNTNFEKFGHISPFGNRDVQEKSISRIRELYGVDNVWKNKGIINKIIQKKKDMGIYYKDDDIKNEYRKYRNKAVYLSRRNIKMIDWDGSDFYTDIYIRDNFNLHYNDKAYPTIDHKIPIIYGFINNIGIDEISNSKNLCWTTRQNNTLKSKKVIQEYIKLIQV